MVIQHGPANCARKITYTTIFWKKSLFDRMYGTVNII